MQSCGLTRFLPFNRHVDRVSFKDESHRITILGIDFLHINPSDLGFSISQNGSWQDTAILVSDTDYRENTALSIQGHTLNTVQFSQDKTIKAPVLLLDIGQYQMLFQDNDALSRLYIYDNDIIKNPLLFNTCLSNHKVSLISDTDSSGKQFLSSAFFLNLKLVGMIGIVISGLLSFKFYRFIFQQRQLTVSILTDLGLSVIKKRQLLLIESGVIILIALVLGMGLGILFSYLGLGILTNTVQLLYYDVPLPSLVFSPWMVYQAIGMTILSVFAAMSTKLYMYLSFFSRKRYSFLGFSVCLFMFLSLTFFDTDSIQGYLGYAWMLGLLLSLFFVLAF